ncbi:unnamed protein product, partial [Prorocentrum cordatum]
MRVAEGSGRGAALPRGARVAAAHYGDAGRTRGADVTEQVRRLAASGAPLRADNAAFGDPLPGVRK